jgi:hypothetical protein
VLEDEKRLHMCVELKGSSMCCRGVKREQGMGAIEVILAAVGTQRIF